MVSLTKVTKVFGRKRALDDISLTFKQGEVVGFLGPNGAGKTTTMRVIVGYLKPTDGTVEVFEKNPIKNRVEVLSQIGYLAENNPQYGEMKVEEYIDFASKIKKAGKESVRSIIDQTGIEEVMDNKIEELSRGFKQRVGLAAALLGDPKLLILDEPTSGLDPIEQEKIRSLIKKLGKKRTVVLSTHILSEIEDVATRLVIIHKGKIVYDGEKPKRKGVVERIFKKHAS